jgi:hypothetical protein
VQEMSRDNRLRLDGLEFPIIHRFPKSHRGFLRQR